MTHDTIAEGLVEIKDFIISQITAFDPEPSFRNSLDKFLQRLIQPREGTINKDPNAIKAGRQLLCNIGIDIKHMIVPPEHYLTIFKLVRMDDGSKDARKLFREAVIDHRLFYRKAEEKEIKGFCMIVFPMKDLHYYWNGAGVNGKMQVSYAKESALQTYRVNHRLELTCHEFNKNRDAPEIGYFWVTTRENIEEMVQSVQDPQYITTQIIDRMGLSHFVVEKEDQKHYFYIDLGEITFTSFKPNATLVDWDSSLTGFLSCFKKQPEGHTFSITGYKNFGGGIAERVFLKIQLNDEQRKKASIKFFDPPVIPPIPIEAEDLIKEGIRRFNTSN